MIKTFLAIKNNYIPQQRSVDRATPDTASLQRNNLKDKVDITNPLLYSNNLCSISFSGLCRELKNVVDHCAICGGKVYSEAKIEKLIDELLASKGDRLIGKLQGLINDLTQPDVTTRYQADRNKSVAKQRVKSLRKMIVLAKQQPEKTARQIIEEDVTKLRLAKKRLEQKSPEKIMYYMYYPFIESVDHIQPRIKGGVDSRDNYLECCIGCNNFKSAMDPVKFLTTYPEVLENIDQWNDEYKAAIAKNSRNLSLK